MRSYRRRRGTGTIEARVSTGDRPDRPLDRLVGPVTTFLIGLGIAIGSGIFRTPGIVASQLGAPTWIVGIWLAGGGVALAQALVNAELATRFPRSGGEYAFLREAYGEMVAFFFGYGYTVFILGGGCGTIAAAAGEAAADLFVVDPSHAPVLGACAVALVALVNAIGLRAGSGFSNGLTVLKLLALLAVAAVAFFRGGASPDWHAPLTTPAGTPLATALVAATLPVLWAYDGTTDSIKMAEEIVDVRRELPRVLVLSAGALTALYLLVNLAFLQVLPPDRLAASRFAASDVMEGLFGGTGRRLMSALALLVFSAALSTSLLATVRVTFALARDGLTFPIFGRMSARQAPVPALILVGVIAGAFTLVRGFQQILNIYFLAAAFLFGLSYGSLLVFRWRDHRAGRPFPEHAFRCPGGIVLASLLILLQAVLALRIVEDNARDSLYTLGLLGSFALFYLLWRRIRGATARG